MLWQLSIVNYQLSIEMMNNEQDDRFEKRLRFVARRYKEGSLDEDKAWERFVSRQGIRRQVAGILPVSIMRIHPLSKMH